MSRRAASIKERATSAEGRAAAAKERAAWVIDDNKASLAFEAEVVEDCVKAYWFGFGDYKEAVAWFPNLDLIGIEILAVKEDMLPRRGSCCFGS